MSEVEKLKLSYSGIGKLLRGPEMEAFMQQKGNEIARTAGDGYTSRVHKSEQRQIANVYASSAEARQDNKKNNTLLKSLR